tara:strand:+ start:317 stop:727 length:411 start_codon:yes stop_codon:yes gene_type:complete
MTSSQDLQTFEHYLFFFRQKTERENIQMMNLDGTTHGGITEFKNLAHFKEHWDKQRIYEYMKKHPDADYVPARVSEDVQPSKYVKRGTGKKITVSSKTDKREYNRQYAFFRKYPNETVCPPKGTYRTVLSAVFAPT